MGTRLHTTGADPGAVGTVGCAGAARPPYRGGARSRYLRHTRDTVVRALLMQKVSEENAL